MTIIMAQICFSNIEEFIRINIASAKKRIYVAVAWFTNDVLFKELLTALERNVEIKIILLGDILNRGEFGLDFGLLIQKKADVRFASSSQGIMHHKFCVIDDSVITGSYNWTYYANKNQENIVLLNDPEIVKGYYEQYEKLLKICEPIVLPYEHLQWSEITESDFTELRQYLIKEVRCQNDNTSQSKEEKLSKLSEAYKRGNVADLNAISLLPVTEEIAFDGYNYRGVPILRKEWNPKKHYSFLNNISIREVPKGRPNAGKKYVHARYTSNDLHFRDMWVDIFDTEYVNEVTLYFHKKDGGLIDDSLPLPGIPEKIYNTCSKYKFKKVLYLFNKDWLDKTERMKIGRDGTIIVNKEGSPCTFDHFNTLIRYDDRTQQYVEYNSMTELCHLIVQSLFSPNKPDEHDYIGDYSCLNGVFRATIDDLYGICKLEVCGQNGTSAQSLIDALIKLLRNHPEYFWVYKKDSVIYSYAYGEFINNISQERDDVIAHNEINGNWFKLIRFKASSVYDEKDKFGVLLEGIIEDIKGLGKIGMVYECTSQQVPYYEKYGFRREPISRNKNSYLLKLTFT